MDDHKRNLVYFEAGSMRELYDQMDTWQIDNQKRLLSTSVERDGAVVCCIALTNAMEVVIVSGKGDFSAAVTQWGQLHTLAHSGDGDQ